MPARLSAAPPMMGSGNGWASAPGLPISLAPAAGEADAANDAAGPDNRRAPRTNMFITASAEVEGRALTARIRNMSSTGALIEVSGPVRKGERLVLKRGDHIAKGAIAWSAGFKCGIAFSDLVCVSTWMGRPPARESDGQKRVDAIQAQIRSGAAAPPAVDQAPAQVGAQLLQQRLSEEMIQLKQIVDRVGEALAGEPAILEQHAGTMQQFDIVSQTLGHLARLMIAPDPIDALGVIGMDSLRQRLGRAPDQAVLIPAKDRT